MKNKLILLLLLITASSSILAQTVEVFGVVTSKEGEETLIGVSVYVKGTTTGTATDVDGKYSLKVPVNSTLTFSYMGFNSRDIVVKKGGQLDVVLSGDQMVLQEVVAIGYGTMKKSDMTGAISSVDVDELSKRSTTNAAEALQGKIAGVNIQKAGGNAGAGVQVKIRGVKTFGDNQPLYIIDGFPGDIDSVNPQDIASMEVLKDGAAAAIYGSVAANGVIIITTKNGKKGETKVDFSSYLSYTKIAKKLDMLNAAEYKQVHKQMYENYNKYASNPRTLPAYITKDTGVDTDWQDAMMRSGLAQNYMASVRGGSENAQYSISYNHADEKGIFLGNEYRQDNARAKIRMSKYIFDVDANLSFRFTDSRQPEYQLKEMYMISPLVPIYDDNNEYGFGLTNFDGIPNNRNVMADQHYEKTTNKRYLTTGNVALTMNFTSWLTFKTSYNYQGQHRRQTYHTPKYVADTRSKRDYPYHEETTSYWEEQVFDNVLNFNKQFGKHSVNAMAGTSVSSRKYTWNSVGVEGKTIVYEVRDGKLESNNVPGGFLLNEYFSTVGAGIGGTFTGDGTNWKYNRVSFFGRLNYNYDNRYLLQVTFRRDGSSKFHKDNRWGDFPSVALGWRISEEAFFPKDIVLNNLRLRASWGRLGNEGALGYYDFQSLISSYNTKYQGYVQGDGQNPWLGSSARGLEYRPLKWETTDTKNIGVDFGFYNNKLTGTFNYYHNTTEDLLITKALSPSSGLTDPILNVGEMRNTGIELEVNWADRINKFDYNIGFNMSTTSNKVTKLADSGQVLWGEGLKYGEEHFPTQTRVGKPIGAFYLYKTNGIFQNDAEVAAHVNKNGELLQPNARPGDIRFVDTDGNGAINDDDKVYSGSAIPKFEVNLNLGAGYKGFDLSMVIGSAWGHKLYNGNKYFYEGMNSGSNFLRSTLKAWTPENTNTSVPRAVFQDPNGNLKESDRFLDKGDFIRLRQIQLGYSLPKSLLERVYIDKLRFYISGENLLTWTDYSGIDPEFSRDNVLNAGIDNLIYPFTRSFTVGVQLTF